MNFILTSIFLAFILQYWVNSRPLDDEHTTSLPVIGPVATVDFLRKFGYLDTMSNKSESETIYSEESIREAIIRMQEFGGLTPTGVIDDDTRELLNKPRCGVPDIIKNNDSRRSKRYAIGSKGWKKRHITYSFQNWSPKLGEYAAEQEMKTAFDIWAPYAHLKFIKKASQTDADTKISFGRGYHGDSYPFDGKGHILAHAYFPTDYGTLGGDIHFDEDEDWWSPDGLQRKNDLPSPVSFALVSAHEIGHSLGLAHSSDTGSIMFPYYQGKQGKPALGYDDMLALYQLYIRESTVDEGGSSVGNEDDEDENSGEEGNGSNSSGERGRRSTTTSTSTTEKSTTKESTVITSHTEKSTSSRTTEIDTDDSSDTSNENQPDDKSWRNLCSDTKNYKEGPLKISFLRNEIFIFRDEYMWRIAVRGERPPPAYPVKISRLFPPLNRIDAAYERDSDGKLIFFSDNLYWRYNDTAKRMDDGYPMSIDRWGGVPENFDSVIRYSNGKSYFFKDNEFWAFDDTSVHVEENYPKNTKRFWFGC